MKALKRIALLAGSWVISGIVAFLLATVMAETGLLGSCFEGSCGYVGMFLVFPLAWVILFSASIAVYSVLKRR